MVEMNICESCSTINLRITGFLDSVHRPELQLLENTTLRKLDPFPSSGEERERETHTYSVVFLRKS
jgi:hypothetical protein